MMQERRKEMSNSKSKGHKKKKKKKKKNYSKNSFSFFKLNLNEFESVIANFSFRLQRNQKFSSQLNEMSQNQNQNHPEDFDDDDDFTWALCPISLSPMADPVMTPSGHSFEREAIEDWLSTNGTNPMTNEALNKRQLIPNRCLHDAIEAWKKRNADWEERIASIKEDLLAKNEQQNNANGDEELKRRLKDFKAALGPFELS